MSRPPSPPSADTPTAQRTASELLVWSGQPSIIPLVVDVREYSRRIQQGPGSGRHITEFEESGCIWRVKIYPDGLKGSSDVGWVSVFLQLYRGNDMDGEGAAMAQFSVSLLDQDGEAVPSYSRNSSAIRRFASRDQYGYRRLIAGHELMRYLRDDCFSVRCEVVVHNIYVNPVDAPRAVVVPPSDLQRQLLALLRSGRGGDVTFEVGGEVFSAHRYMLAARSPVFMAQLLGPMAENAAAARVRIDDMEPRAFEAMLEFIYTDWWPDEGMDVEMAQHLLVAADRYDLGRLKLLCEDTLCDTIDTSTAATTLALAEQHGCRALREACVYFLRWIPGNLEAAMASDGFEHLKASCPALVKAIVDDEAEAVAVAGSHVLTIEDYSHIQQGLGNGTGIPTMEFVVGGRRWCMHYYPDGHSSEHVGWISVFLMLDSGDVGTAVKARYEISLLGLDGKLVPSCSMASQSTPCEFSGERGHGGALVERKVLEESGYLKDDAFSVRCEITMTE